MERCSQLSIPTQTRSSEVIRPTTLLKDNRGIRHQPLLLCDSPGKKNSRGKSPIGLWTCHDSSMPVQDGFGCHMTHRPADRSPDVQDRFQELAGIR